MKKSILLFSLSFSLFFIGCGSSSEQKGQEAMPVADTSKGVSAMTQDTSAKELAYICPCGGCPEIREKAPGKCSKCEMDLVAEKH